MSPADRVTTDRGHRSGQLLIGELAQEVQEFLPRRQVLRYQHLQRVVLVRVHGGLIELADGQLQPLLLLRGQRAQSPSMPGSGMPSGY